MPTDNICLTCRFFRDIGGECRYNAPTTPTASWPVVTFDDWCGKWTSATASSADNLLGKQEEQETRRARAEQEPQS